MDIKPLNLMQIIVNYKCQIRFAASKIYYINRRFVVALHDIVHDLRKSVDLLKLVIHGVHNLAILCKYAQMGKYRDIHSLFKYVFLSSVVPLNSYEFILRVPLIHSYFALL